MVINTLPCKDCGIVFEREKKRGRPPTRCQDCRDKIAVDQEIIVSLVDPETLYAGPIEKLLGDKAAYPQGSESQCCLCWRIFTSDSSCESHKVYLKDTTICSDPASIGMVPKERRGLPVWVKPAPLRWES